MPAYRLCSWSPEHGRVLERVLDAESARDDGVLLESFDRIGRDALRLSRGASSGGFGRPAPGKLARARRHLRVALRLLEETGEYLVAARTSSSLADLCRREERIRGLG